MSITYYQSNRILDRNFGGTAYTVPSTLYWGLSTTTIGNDGSGSTEPAAGGYARVAQTNNKTNWNSASNGTVTNAVAVQFAESSSSWGTITYVFISDAITSGNMLYFEALSPSRAVAANTTVLFAASAITITMVNP